VGYRFCTPIFDASTAKLYLTIVLKLTEGH